MNRHPARLGATSLLLIAAASPAFCQSATTGGITGMVRGADGKALAGATVRLTSGQVQRTVSSDASGVYRLGLMNPGQWSLEVVKEGFQPFKTKATLLTNNDQTVNITLAPLTGATVEVVGLTANVDFTSTTSGLNLDIKDMDSLPKGRDFNSLIQLAPGTSQEYANGAPGVGGSSISGASGAENSFVVDGMTTTDFRFGTQGSQLKTDFIEQLEVQTGGFRPEFSALGGVVNAITKSGSNETKGSTWATWDPGGVQAKAKGNAYVNQDPPQSRLDLGFELGGPLLKDKLFYYVGADQESSKGQSPLPNQDPGLVGSQPTIDRTQVLAKLNWFINPDLQVTAAASKDRNNRNQDRNYVSPGTVNVGYRMVTDTTSLSLGLDWTLASNLQLSAKIGSVDILQLPTYYNSDGGQAVWDYYHYVGGPGALTHPELAGVAYWATGSRDIINNGDIYGKSKQARIDLNYFIGTHAFKIGYCSVDASTANGQKLAGPVNAASIDGAWPVVYVVDPYQRLIVAEIHSQGTSGSKSSGIYAQDIWEVSPGVRLMYGARMESQRVLGGGETMLSFSGSKYIQPRLGLTWDLNQDGKTKLSASYAVYYESIPNIVGAALYGGQVFTQKIYYPGSPAWSYNNGNPTLFAPNGYQALLDASGQLNHAPVADGTKLPKRKEFTVGFDQALPGDWTLGIHGKYRKLVDPIEESVLTSPTGTPYDSAPASTVVPGVGGVAWPGQGIIWNPGPTASWTAQNNPTSLNPGAHISVADTLYPTLYNDYKSLDLALSQRTERNFLNFSYTWSRADGNYQGVSYGSGPNPLTQGLANYTQAYLHYFNVGKGPLANDRTHTIKLQNTHQFNVAGRNLDFGVVLNSYSGTPISHFDSTHDFTTATGGGGTSPVGGQYGGFGRNHWQSLLDLHLDYVIPVTSKLRVIPSMDCFNALNTRVGDRSYEVAVVPGPTAAPNPRLGSDLNWPLGRRYTFGVKLQF